MFVLSLSVSSSTLAQIKAELTRGLPLVKSSHRVEALGRGFRFQIYAALLAASQSATPPVVTVDGALFSAYLKEHGFEVEPKHLYRACARIAIQGVLDKEPRLHFHGIGFERPHRNRDGSRKTPQEQYTEFLALREACLGPKAAEAFLRALAFLARVPRTKTIRSGTSSYRLKHIAENYRCTYPEGAPLGPDYVPNGMLIAAALHIGFKHKLHIDELGYDTLNPTFNMSKVVVDDLDTEIRPRGGFARDRARKQLMREARTRVAPF